MAEKLLLDNSKRSTWIRCPRRYYYEYILGIEPTQGSIAMFYGTVWHRVKQDYCELLKKYKETQDPIYIAKITNLADSIPAIWEEELATQNQEIYPDYRNATSLRTAFVTYLRDFLPYDLTNVEITALEEVLSTEVKSDIWGNFDYCGKIDLRCKLNGSPAIVDYKTTGWNLFQLKQANALSPQFTGYAFLSQRCLDEPLSFVVIQYHYISSRKKKDGNYGVVDIKFDTDVMSVSEQSINQWLDATKVVATQIQFASETGHYIQIHDNCYKYNKNCSYLPLCQQNKQAGDETLTMEFRRKVKSWDSVLKEGVKEQSK